MYEKRNLVNWFLSPVFQDFNLPEYDRKRIAKLIVQSLEEEQIDKYSTEDIVTEVVGLDDSDYSENEFLEPILQLKDDVNRNKHFFKHFFVHGSIATLDYVIGWSDLDTLVVIKDEWVQSLDRLMQLQNFFFEINVHLRTVDVLAHHGYITVLESNLKNYSNLLMPIEVIKESKSLLQDDIMQVQMVDSEEQEIQRLIALRSEILRFKKQEIFYHHPYKSEYLSDESMKKRVGMYQLKYLIGAILSIPSLYFSIIGKPRYKKYTFEPFIIEFKEYSQIIKNFSAIRSNWDKFENYDASNNKIPEWVFQYIEPNYKEQIIALLDNVLNEIKYENSIK